MGKKLNMLMSARLFKSLAGDKGSVIDTALGPPPNLNHREHRWVRRKLRIEQSPIDGKCRFSAAHSKPADVQFRPAKWTRHEAEGSFGYEHGRS